MWLGGDGVIATRRCSPAARAAAFAAFDKEAGKGKAAVLLRLAFHDAAAFDAGRPSGANASIQFELSRPENIRLNRGWRVIEAVRRRLEGTPAAGLSASDLIALGGAYAVKVTGGPDVEVQAGRVDALAGDPPGGLPGEDESPTQLIANFAAKGLTPTDLVALSGAHTARKTQGLDWVGGEVGRHELRPPTPPAPSTLPFFQLGAKGFGDPVTFDNTYYKTLLEEPWAHPRDEMDTHIGLPSDRALPKDALLRPLIEKYAADQDAFFAQFAASYAKMTRLGWE